MMGDFERFDNFEKSWFKTKQKRPDASGILLAFLLHQFTSVLKSAFHGRKTFNFEYRKIKCPD